MCAGTAAESGAKILEMLLLPPLALLSPGFIFPELAEAGMFPRLPFPGDGGDPGDTGKAWLVAASPSIQNSTDLLF